ncbi:putative ATP-dependent bile acid permease [Xylogone sp. PMI_703]|nr:putative ATP-dependent bile acid permease [Xylogone sp. PMI_703]
MALSFLHCPSPVWDNGRVSTCVQRNYLSILIPLVTCAISLVLLRILPRIHRNLRAQQSPHSEPLSSSENRANGVRYITLTSPRSAQFEGRLLLADVTVGVVLVLYASQLESARLSPWVSVLSSTYLYFLYRSRTRKDSKDPALLAQLWSHSSILYTSQWLCLSVIAYAATIEHFDPYVITVVGLRLALFTLLLLLQFTAPRALVDGFDNGDDYDSVLPSEEQTASLLSRLTFWWVGDLVWKPYRNTLQVSDLHDLTQDQKSSVVASSFHLITSVSLPLLWRLYHFFKWDILLQGTWAAIMSVAMFVPAVLLRLILDYLESPDIMTRMTAWLCVAGLFVSGVLFSLADCHCEWIGRRISTKMRAILINELYTKALRRKLSESPDEGDDRDDPGANISNGTILNLMAIDSTNISEISAYLHFVWISFPLQISVATYLLYRTLGISGVGGVVLMLVLLPLNVAVNKRQSTAQAQLLTATDARIHSSNEFLSNIRIIKFCAWENGIKERITKLRNIELKRLRSYFIWWSISMTIWYSIPFIVTILTLLFYTVIFRNSLESSVAFPALAVFALLRMPLDRVAATISFVLQAHVSLVRVDRFLKEEETSKYVKSLGEQDSSIGFDNATLEWSSRRLDVVSIQDDIQLPDISPTTHFRLHNLKISFLSGRLNIVCGASGSGKTSLLLALLGEMSLLQGRILLPSDVDEANSLFHRFNRKIFAYCSQEPWIMNRTIRANILFGLPFDSQRYQSVLNAVALSEDLKALDKADETMAGEKGSRLSGGQKQRVSLARALYSRAQYVLLDDCLSAVDSKTARHIFFHAIKGPLMNERACILATHNTRLVLPHCDFAVFLENGQVKAQGTPKSLVLAGIIGAGAIEGQDEQPELPTRGLKSDTLTDSNQLSRGELLSDSDVTEIRAEAKADYEEDKSIGAVGWPVMRFFLISMGAGWFWTIFFSNFAAQQLTSLGTNLWIKLWAHQYDIQEKKSGLLPQAQDKVDPTYYLAVYGVICLTFVTISFFRDAITLYGALKASSRIHDRLLNSVLHAKLVFFDKVPLGQITNRFSKDIEVLDRELAPYMISTLQLSILLVIIIILISTVFPTFFLIAVIVCLVYYSISTVYINSSRDLKRIESVERSPLYQQFGETLSGYVTIRAYGNESSFTKQTHRLIDCYNRPHNLLWAAKEWLTFRVGSISSLISALTGSFALWQLGSINSGVVGLVLTYASTFTENVLWLVQLYAIIQQNFNSIVRLIEYIEVEQELSKPANPTFRPPAQWPSQGWVYFQGYSTKYAPNLEPILRSINFEARPGQRVAIVGRTGAGKSTVTLALIRALEASGGQIMIDGVDIAAISLEQLRQAVTVVPQDPTIFNGNLRDNMDPLRYYTDEEIFAALRNVHLLDSLGSSSLDQPVTSLSLGQRQLMCIARGLLRRSRILVLDEATASIDSEMDALVQSSLRTSIVSGTTVLTIAHRLHTIADYDRVVVLDAGRVVEQGSIKHLLSRRGPDAVFRNLCEESGDLEKIERVANKAS